MTSFVALLRGINVGTAKRIPMANLRALLNDLGYTDEIFWYWCKHMRIFAVYRSGASAMAATYPHMFAPVLTT
jgi:hypothetical protein